MDYRIKKLTLKTKLLICEFKEKYPAVPNELVSEILQIDIPSLNKFFNDEYIIAPSKMNKINKKNERLLRPSFKKSNNS